MKTKNIAANITPSLKWVPHNPVWQNMIVGSSVSIKTYTLCNVSKQDVVIDFVGLHEGKDNRLRISGGTCKKGVRLAPKATATIHVEVDPRMLGQIDQVLYVKPTDNSPLLRSRIVFSVVVKVGELHGKKSILVDDTPAMDRARRLAEQDGHRHLAKVHARDHDNTPQSAPEGTLQNSILQNPWLDSPRFDGIDNNLNPAPALNPAAEKEFNDERQQQEMEKQLRLGNTPKFSNAPKPQGPF